MMAKKSVSDWYGPGVLSGRDGYPLPHKVSNVGSEGPKRLVGAPRTPKAPVKSTKKPIPRGPLKDKYGRVISRAEYERREGFRDAKRSTPSAVRPNTSQIDKGESSRRKKYRKAAPSDAYRTKTRNLDLPTGISSRQVNFISGNTARSTAGTADAKARAAAAARKRVADGYLTVIGRNAAKKTKGTADARARAAAAARKKALSGNRPFMNRGR
jgi:hypothetical protein